MESTFSNEGCGMMLLSEDYHRKAELYENHRLLVTLGGYIDEVRSQMCIRVI